jgi:flagella basal body P-ring formation protein FlgA
MRLKFGIFFLFLLSQVVFSTDATVVTREYVQCSESEVRLGDVADIFGLNRILVAKLHSVYLGEAPKEGETLKIIRPDIQRRLTISGIKSEQINLTGAFQTVVTNNSVPEVSNPLYAVIDNYLKGYFADSGEEYEVQFRHLPEPDIKATSGAVFKVSSAKEEKLRDNVVIIVSAFKNGKVIKSYPVSLKIRCFRRILVANQNINHHQILSPEMFSYERRETTRMLQPPLTNVDAVKGKWATRLISRGSVVTVDKIEPIPAIKQGDLVTIAFDAEDFQITAQGRARKSGLIGEEIPVLNLDSLKEINAKVRDARTVVVEYTRK